MTDEAVWLYEFLYRGRGPDEKLPPAWAATFRTRTKNPLDGTYTVHEKQYSMEALEQAGQSLQDILGQAFSQVLGECEGLRAITAQAEEERIKVIAEKEQVIMEANILAHSLRAENEQLNKKLKLQEELTERAKDSSTPVLEQLQKDVAKLK